MIIRVVYEIDNKNKVNWSSGIIVESMKIIENFQFSLSNNNVKHEVGIPVII